MKFETAMANLRVGHDVYRASWGAGKYLRLSAQETTLRLYGAGYPDGEPRTWHPSLDELLAEDWEILPRGKLTEKIALLEHVQQALRDLISTEDHKFEAVFMAYPPHIRSHALIAAIVELRQTLKTSRNATILLQNTLRGIRGSWETSVEAVLKNGHLNDLGALNRALNEFSAALNDATRGD